MASESRAHPRKKAVKDSKPKESKKVSKKKVSKKDAHRVVKPRSFDNEVEGDYSTEHIILKLKRIRDHAIKHLLEATIAGNTFGTGGFINIYEAAIRNLDREQAIAEGRTPGESGQVTINIPGLTPGNIVIAGQPGSDDN